MHKFLANELHIKLLIEPQGPLLIKSGTEGAADPSLPDMNFVRTVHPQRGDRTVYLPGSSLKGVLRSHSERICRTLGVFCCNPFESDKNSSSRFCGLREYDKEKPADKWTPKVYRESCRVCQTFGSTQLASRLFITDAYPPVDKYDVTMQTQERTSVGIDRLTGGSKEGALFNFEVVVQGAFEAELTFSNCQLWQLGLLGLCLRDFNQHRLRLGYGTSRGLGFVSATVTKAEMRYTGFLMKRNGQKDLRSRAGLKTLSQPGKTIIYGVGALLSQVEADQYGLTAECAECDGDVEPQADGITVIQPLNNLWDTFLRNCVEHHWAQLCSTL